MTTDVIDAPHSLEVLFGVKLLEPIKYRIVGGQVPVKWWQRRREEWFVESNYMRLGPFPDRMDALDMWAGIKRCG